MADLKEEEDFLRKNISLSAILVESLRERAKLTKTNNVDNRVNIDLVKELYKIMLVEYMILQLNLQT